MRPRREPGPVAGSTREGVVGGTPPSNPDDDQKPAESPPEMTEQERRRRSVGAGRSLSRGIAELGPTVLLAYPAVLETV